MNDTKYLETALEIAEHHKLSKFIDVLIEYWGENPPIPGHGFVHVIQVAVESYAFGEENNYEKPEYLFLGGLFHDIYRPAEGKHGEEDQTPGADVVKELFQKNNLDKAAMKLIVGVIKTHDNWRGTDNPPVFDLYLSLGDKASHTQYLVDSYVWINNRKRFLMKKEPVYSNHLQTLTQWYRYQPRAWEIFTKYNHVKGVEKSIQKYLDIVKSTIQRYEEDPEGLNFNNYIEDQKNKTKKLEIKYLTAFKIDNQNAGNILKLYDL